MTSTGNLTPEPVAHHPAPLERLPRHRTTVKTSTQHCLCPCLTKTSAQATTPPKLHHAGQPSPPTESSPVGHSFCPYCSVTPAETPTRTQLRRRPEARATTRLAQSDEVPLVPIRHHRHSGRPAPIEGRNPLSFGRLC